MSALGFTDRVVDRASRLLGRKVSRRGFIAKTTILGSAVAASGCVPLTQQGSPFTFITDCPPGTMCRDGYTEFCCVINSGQNACPPNSFPSGWWRADYSIYCNGTRYYIDCNDYAGGGPCRCAHGCDYRKVYCNHFRYGQCNMQIPGTGVIACRMVTCVPPYLIPELNCVQSGAVDNATAGHVVDCAPFTPPPAPPPPPPPPPPTSPPAVLPVVGGAASPGPGEVVVVARIAGGSVAAQHFTGGAWQGWQTLDLPAGRTAASRVAAASMAAGTVDALVVADDRRLYWRHFEAGAWSAEWVSLGGSYSSDPALVRDGASLRAALRSTAGRTTRTRRLSGSGWSADENLHGVGTSDPTVTPRANGPIVVVRGTDSALYAKRRSGVWPTKWVNLGGVGTSDPVAVADGSSAWLFVRGSNKGIWAKRFTDGWSQQWLDLGGANCTSDPAAVFDGSRLWLFVRRGDGKTLWYRRRTGSWSGWQSLGYPGTGINADVVATRDGSDVVLFARAETELYTLRISDGVPGSWEPLPGVSIAPVRGAQSA